MRKKMGVVNPIVTAGWFMPLININMNWVKQIKHFCGCKCKSNRYKKE
jgi:hypothetical protein